MKNAYKTSFYDIPHQLNLLTSQLSASTKSMVPTDHDIPFSRTFQGLLRYIFKDFSRTFLCSLKHPFAKKWSTMDFSKKTYRDHLISSLLEKCWGGGGRFGYVFLTFSDDLLYYGYNTGSNNPAWRGVWGSSPRKNLLELVQNLAILDNSGGYTSLLLCHNKSRDCPFDTDWYIETHNIHKYLYVFLGKEGYDNNCSRIIY